VIELVPTGKEVVVNVATSFETVPPPSRVEPLKKATVPVGTAEPVLAGVIVAVNVTDVPNDGELGEKMFSAEEPEIATRSAFGESTFDQVVPLKFQMPDPPVTQTSVAEMASTAPVASLPTICVVGVLHVLPFHCRS